MTLESGARLGAYEVLGPLGAGGMGEVYRVRDTRLGREVAIKVLPTDLASDASRLKRFEREAKAASALNHPNIVTIYEFGTEQSVSWIAMERVEGKTLRELLLSGPVSLKKLLEIAVQLAAGLSRAHEAGIVHRDLKPENVMVAKEGLVKILDFGLAKQRAAFANADETSTPTETATGAGVLLGTVGYMSPEQASGESVDFRSDQFSLGSILYELATGKRAFHRKTAVDTLSAILNEEPEPAGRIRPQLPAPVRWIIERCLAKDAGERYISTGDLARELAAVRDHISEISSGAETPIPGRAASRRRLRGLAAAVLVFAAGGAVVWLLGRGRPAAAGAPRFQRVTFQKLGILSARLAPDGTTVVYGAHVGDRKGKGLYQIRIGSPEPRRLDLGTADILAISSGGEMAVKLGEGNVGTLARVPLLGGVPRPVTEGVWWAGADWSADGKDLAIVRSVEGKHRLEFPIGKVLLEDGAGCPRISPRGDWIAFTEGDRVAVIRLDGTRKKALSTGSPRARCSLAWRPDGKEIWFSGADASNYQALYAVDFEGRERLVARVPGELELFDISRDGRVLLAHHGFTTVLRGNSSGDEEERDLAWLDFSVPAQVSADGGLLLFTEMGEGSAGAPSVYMRKTDGSPAVRLGEGTALAFSPDGQWVLARNDGDPPHFAIVPIGTGETRRIPNDLFEALFGGVWLPDGRGIVFTAREKGGSPRVFVQQLDGGKPRAITPPGVGFDFSPSPVSPDGKFVYAWQGSAPTNIYPLGGGEPRPVPWLDAQERPIQWSADGQGLYIFRSVDGGGGIWSVDLTTGRRRLVGKKKLGNFAIISRTVITPDGRYYAALSGNVSSALYLVGGLR